MPTYEYQCKKCGQNVEAFQKFSDPPLKVHADCGGDLRKVFHASGVVFKGAGFYATDSRSTSTAVTNGNGAKNGAKKDSVSEKKDSSTEKVTSSSDSASSESSSSKSS
ncbi:MAG: FmdB family transcriptional regulator [Acidimicrobiia bacterium]|nr:FmdB family transcriptional regulator [Acidimicrobiia bacterium]